MATEKTTVQDEIKSSAETGSLQVPRKTLRMETAKQAFLKCVHEFIAQRKKTMENVTWMTGTNGRGLLPGFRLSNNTLMPLGTMLKNGLAPTVGAYGKGSRFAGVNSKHLSGVAPKNFEVAWQYATYTMDSHKGQEKYRLDIKALDEALLICLGHFEKAIAERRLLNMQEELGDADKLIELTIYILRLRSINEKMYQEKYKKRLEDILPILQQSHVWEPLLEHKKVMEALTSAPLFIAKDSKDSVLAIKLRFQSAGYNIKIFGYIESSKINYDEHIFEEGNLRPPFRLHRIVEAEDAMLNNSFATRIMMIRTIEPAYFEKEEIQAKKSAMLNHVARYVDELTQALESFTSALTRPKIDGLTEKEQVLLRDGRCPLILATIKKLENCRPPAYQGEIGFPGTLKLGEDLSLMITDEAHEKEIRRWLQSQGLRKKVFVCTANQYTSARTKCKN